MSKEKKTYFNSHILLVISHYNQMFFLHKNFIKKKYIKIYHKNKLQI